MIFANHSHKLNHYIFIEFKKLLHFLIWKCIGRHRCRHTIFLCEKYIYLKYFFTRTCIPTNPANLFTDQFHLALRLTFASNSFVIFSEINRLIFASKFWYGWYFLVKFRRSSKTHLSYLKLKVKKSDGGNYS
jgi:hypothetical protein